MSTDQNTSKKKPRSPEDRKRFVALIVIFFTVFIDLVGFGIVLPMLQPFALEKGATEFQAGFLVAVFSIFQFLLAPVWGALSDRFGRKPILLLTLLGTSASYAVLGIADSLFLIFVGRICAGIFAGNIAVAQAYIADVTPPEKRAHGMGMIGMAFGFGFILGPAIGGILSKFSFSLPALAAAGTSGLAFLLGAVRLNESLSEDHRQASVRIRHPLLNVKEVLDERPVMALNTANFLWMATFSMWETVFVLFAESEVYPSMDEGEVAVRVGYLFAYLGLLSAVVQGGMIRPLMKRFTEKGLADIGIVLYALGSLYFIFYYFGSGNRGAGTLLPALTLVALGQGLINPTLSAIVSKLVSPRRQGEVLGSFRGMGSLGRVAGPLAGSVLYAYFSHWSPFLAGALLVGGSFFCLMRKFEFYRETD